MRREKLFIKSFFMLSVFFVLTFLLVGCGGGGGGGGGTSSPNANSGLTYSGPTSQATITNSNANSLAEGALQGSTESGVGSISSAAVTNSNTGADKGGSVLLAITQALNGTAGCINPKSAANSNAASLTQSGPQTIYGPAGGTSTINLTVDNSTGQFSGNMVFSSYSAYGVTLTGFMSISGKTDLSGTSIQMTFGFSSFSVDYYGQSFTMAGTISVSDSLDSNANVTSATGSEDIYLKYNSSDNVYWFHNYLIATSYDSYGTATINASGTYYDPDWGWVTVSTPVDLVLSSTGDFSAGELLVMGVNSQAEFIASSNGYEIMADTIGDGQWDYDSGLLAWSTLGQ